MKESLLRFIFGLDSVSTLETREGVVHSWGWHKAPLLLQARTKLLGIYLIKHS